MSKTEAEVEDRDHLSLPKVRDMPLQKQKKNQTKQK